MTTQAHIILRENHCDYFQMVWINHDAFPDIIIPKIKEAIDIYEGEGVEKLFFLLIEKLNCENLGNFFTVEKTLNQPMNYKYFIEMEDGEVFVRTQEEYWIEQSEEFDKIPSNYLALEMRTIDVEKVI